PFVHVLISFGTISFRGDYTSSGPPVGRWKEVVVGMWFSGNSAAPACTKEASLSNDFDEAGCYTRFTASMKEKREIYRFLHVTPRRIFEQLDQFVIGQRRAQEVLAIAAYNHLKRIEYLKYCGETTIRKSNILMMGPSRSGKTYL